jgi:hypothetical protein
VVVHGWLPLLLKVQYCKPEWKTKKKSCYREKLSLQSFTQKSLPRVYPPHPGAALKIRSHGLTGKTKKCTLHYGCQREGNNAAMNVRAGWGRGGRDKVSEEGDCDGWEGKDTAKNTRK